MAEPYMYDYGPKWFIGLGLTRITINTKGDRIYPEPSGKVSKEIAEACNKLRGTKKSIPEILALIKPQLTKEYANEKAD